MRHLTFLASRFVAGDSLEDAVAAVRKLNGRGLKATLDFLGEDCAAPAGARTAADEYMRMIGAVAENGLDANVSLKLTQFGLNLDRALAEENLERVLEEADKRKIFVRIDMEGSQYTEITLRIFSDAFKRHAQVGPVIQAYLRRSAGDIAELNRMKARVRLCKGAYKEGPDVAFATPGEVCAQYDRLAAELLEHGTYPALATHDEKRILRAQAAAREKGVSPERFEFQMLYGLRPKRWRSLREEGHNVRVYVPYGTHWLPYFYRRLRERKENWLFVLRGLFEG